MAGEANASWGSWLGWAGHLPGASLDLASTAVGTVFGDWSLLITTGVVRQPLVCSFLFFYHYIYLFTCGRYVPHCAC